MMMHAKNLTYYNCENMFFCGATQYDILKCLTLKHTTKNEFDHYNLKSIEDQEISRLNMSKHSAEREGRDIKPHIEYINARF